MSTRNEGAGDGRVAHGHQPQRGRNAGRVVVPGEMCPDDTVRGDSGRVGYATG